MLIEIPQLQISPTDIINTLLNDPRALSFVIIFISGYVFLLITSRGGLRRKIGADERTLIGAALGAGFEAMFFFLWVAVENVLHQVSDVGTIYYISVGTTFLTMVALPLALHAGKESET